MVAEVGPFAMLARMLANLRQLFLASGDAVGTEWVVRLRTARCRASTPPKRRELLGRLEAALGKYGEAAANFDVAAASDLRSAATSRSGWSRTPARRGPASTEQPAGRAGLARRASTRGRPSTGP